MTDVDLDVSNLEQEWEQERISDRILRWRFVIENGITILQFLVTFKDLPLEEAAWIGVDRIEEDDRLEFLQDLRQDNPTKDPSSDPSVSDADYDS